MGSLKVAYTTGDNDPEIYPTESSRRYYYCDQCGSFKLSFIPAPSFFNKHKTKGLFCKECKAEYLWGSLFFKRRSNPRKYTEDDIPTVSEHPYFE